MSEEGCFNSSGSITVCFVGPSFGFRLITPPKKAAVAAENTNTRKIPTWPPELYYSGTFNGPLILVFGYASPLIADLTADRSTDILACCYLSYSLSIYSLFLFFSSSSSLFAYRIFSSSSSVGGFFFIYSANFCLLSASILASSRAASLFPISLASLACVYFSRCSFSSYSYLSLLAWISLASSKEILLLTLYFSSLSFYFLTKSS